MLLFLTSVLDSPPSIEAIPGVLAKIPGTNQTPEVHLHYIIVLMHRKNEIEKFSSDIESFKNHLSLVELTTFGLICYQ